MSTEPRIVTLATEDHGDVTLDRVFAHTTPGPRACVIWTAGIGGGGYGWTRLDGRSQPAHRVVYKLIVGSIAPGLQVDHTCHNEDASCPGGETCLHRRCVNPFHLEAVTNGENSRRSPHTLIGRNIRANACVNGHPFDEANTYIRKDGHGRVCRQCRADRMRAYAAEKRIARPSDLPICGHVSRNAKKVCTRPPGHTGKHHAQYEVTR
jgi:hypothetical protein